MNKVAKWRRKFGLSQKELADALGVAQNTVSNWERGKRHISTNNLLALSSFFGVSTDELIGLSTPKTVHTFEKLARQEIKDFIAQEYGDEAANILSSLKSLNEKGRSRAVQAVEDLSQVPKYRVAEKSFTLRVARSNDKKSAITNKVNPKTIEKLQKAKAIKNEKDLK